MRVVTNGVGWYPVNHKSELKNWILERPESNRGRSSILFLLREFLKRIKTWKTKVTTIIK